MKFASVPLHPASGLLFHEPLLFAPITLVAPTAPMILDYSMRGVGSMSQSLVRRQRIVPVAPPDTFFTVTSTW